MKLKMFSLILAVIFVLSACGGKSEPSEEETSEISDEPNEKKIHYIDEDELYDKILGSWAGQAAGVVWGAPTEFNYLKRMIPDDEVPDINSLNLDSVAGQDDLYVEIPFLETMKEHGVDCGLKNLADKFRDSEFPLDHANKIGRENLRGGIEAPMSGHYKYNPHCDDIDWQIESDFLGHIYPGMVNECAARAFEIGHIMNYGDGVYGGVFVAAMHSAAFFADSVDEIITAGISAIPKDTKFRLLLEDVVKWHSEGLSWQENWQNLEEVWGATDRCIWYANSDANIDAKLNAGYILMGLLYGNGDFTESIKISMQCGQDSDCNPSSVGGILGNYYGFEALPEIWTSKINMTGYQFAYTNHTMKSAVELNYVLALEMLELKGFKKDGRVWEIVTDDTILSVPFEQWPDIPSAEVDFQIIDNILSVNANIFDLNGIKTILWDFGDGAADISGNTVHVYEEAGEYDIKCTITNVNDGVFEIEKTIKIEAIKKTISPDKGNVRNIANSGVPICSDFYPTGSGSKSLEVIRDGKKSGSNTAQYDTYIGYVSKHDDFVGYIFYEEFNIDKIIFTDGMHFDNGGWFADGTLKAQIYKNGGWVDIDCTVTPEYPNANSMNAFGANFREYTFTFDEVKCKGIRLIGIAGGSAGFISIVELEVFGVEAQ